MMVLHRVRCCRLISSSTLWQREQDETGISPPQGSPAKANGAAPWTGLLALVAGLACALAPRLGSAASLEEVIQRVKPAIVAVGTYEPLRSPQYVFRGTGFAVGDGLFVVTNAHVLPDALAEDRLETLSVAVPALGSDQPQRRDARAVVVDRDHDLAVLRISGIPLPTLSLAPTDIVREGQNGAFTGFPMGGILGLVPVTHRAIVAAVSPGALPRPSAGQLDERLVRRFRGGAYKVLQLDSLVYPGNSGSPLYDPATGEVFGVINLAYVQVSRNAEQVPGQFAGIGFAVHVQYLRALITGLK